MVGPRAGRLEWIGVRPRPRGAIAELACVEAIAAYGLVGDYRSHKGGGRRQVTLVAAEHLDLIAAALGTWRVEPGETRRNLVVSGIEVPALKSGIFSIGEVVFEGTGSCDPCRKMDAALGPGGARAMRGLGGITARILIGGALRVGDEVKLSAVRTCDDTSSSTTASVGEHDGYSPPRR